MERDDRPLVDIFNIIFQALKLAEKDELVDIKNNINETVELKNKVQSLGLYSSNEDLEEVSTKTLKYFLVSYFEGYFRLKLHDKNPSIETLTIIHR